MVIFLLDARVPQVVSQGLIFAATAVMGFVVLRLWRGWAWLGASRCAINRRARSSSREMVLVGLGVIDDLLVRGLFDW